MKRIYLDNAATTSLDPKVKGEMDKYEKAFGNASSLHTSGRQAKKVVDDSRKKIAKILNAGPDEIIFTGSGTESCNLAVLGVARANSSTKLPSSAKSYKGQSRAGKNKGHIITTKIEHHAVLNSCKQLEKEGFRVTYLDIDKNGIINPEDIKKEFRPDTILVSIMYANNEIGTIQPLFKIAKLISEFKKRKNQIPNSKFQIHEKTPFFHTDAIQAAGYLDLNVQKLGVDLMSLNGSKIYGPKGIGCLYIKRGINIEPMIYGGSQERGLRPGTESPVLIAGFAKALEIAGKFRIKESKRLEKLRNYAIEKTLKNTPKSRLNGHQGERLPNNINISFPNIDGEMLVLVLDKKGIEVSTGAACTTEETGPSHILKLLYGKKAKPDNLRITLGRQTKKEDIDYLLKILLKEVERLRNLKK